MSFLRKQDLEIAFIQLDLDIGDQLLLNLITNASEAIGEKSGIITLTTGVMDCDAKYFSQSRLEEKPEAGRFV